MTATAPRQVVYEPGGPTLKTFHLSPAFVRGIMGPLGSGKSTACTLEILNKSMQQPPSIIDGIRKTRWAIIRNTYPELKMTTLKTWNVWCPAEFGKMTNTSPMRHHIQNGNVDMEVYFLALDKDEDVRKLLSLELTGAWINEAREVPKGIVDALTGRVGRFPSMADGGCLWSGIMMDTNPPDDQSWWYRLAEEETPADWEFLKQPGGLSPTAENLKNLPPNYYPRLLGGKDPDWVKVYVNGEYGYVTEGKPVFPMFRDRIHVAPTALKPNEGFPLLLGVDFGLTPCAIVGQKMPDGRWIILDEFTTDNCGITRFSEVLRSFLAQKYSAFQIDCGWGDPAGNAKIDEHTSFEILRINTPWQWREAPTNDLALRLEVVVGTLNRLVDGNPGILISPECKFLRKGMNGAYHYKPVRTGSSQQFHETPAKNAYSHIQDALQYLLLGGGEHHVVLRKDQRRNRTVEVISDYKILS